MSHLKTARLRKTAELEMRIAMMEHEAGMRDSLNNFFLKFVKNPFDRVTSLPKKVYERPLEDIFEVAIETLAPRLTEVLREASIQAHVEEWKAGYDARERELTLSDGLAPMGDMDDLEDDHSEDWIAGYVHRDTHGRASWGSLQRQVIEQGLREWDDLVEVNVVKMSLSNVLHAINPVELVKHIIHAVKKHGLKVALPIVIAEVIMHSLPVWGSKIVGPKAALALSQVPVTELLTPAYLKWVTGEGEGETEEDGYLDWYEKNFGKVPL